MGDGQLENMMDALLFDLVEREKGLWAGSLIELMFKGKLVVVLDLMPTERIFQLLKETNETERTLLDNWDLLAHSPAGREVTAAMVNQVAGAALAV